MTRTRLFSALFTLLGVLSIAPLARAVPFDNRPKILLHVKPTVSKNACTAGSVNDCQAEAITKATLTNAANPASFYYVYLLGARANLTNLAGMQCGIDYEGDFNATGGAMPIDVLDWHNCASLEFPSGGADAWPGPLGGNLMTFSATTACQTGEVAVFGYFYLGAYAPGQMRIIPRPVDGLAKLADCSAAETEPLLQSDLGFVSFSAGAVTAGCNPCSTACMSVPVTPVTWSRLKNLVPGR